MDDNVRYVESIGCLNCFQVSREFEVNVTYMSGDDGFDAFEHPECPHCKSGRVIENLKVGHDGAA